MLVNSMQEKVDLLTQIFEQGHFTSKELAKIAIGMELNASVTCLAETLGMNPNQRFLILEAFQQQQAELDNTN